MKIIGYSKTANAIKWREKLLYAARGGCAAGVRVTCKALFYLPRNRSMKKLKPILAFAFCLWAIAIATYAAQVRNDRRHGDIAQKINLMGSSTSCSSSSSGTPGA